MTDFSQKRALQFVTALRLRSRSPIVGLNGMIIGVAMVNVLLGSSYGEASQVVTGLGVLGLGLRCRANLMRRRAKFYENDPHLGQNET